MSEAINVLPLTNDGQSETTFTLDTLIITVVTRFNYTVSLWSMDILDAAGETMVAGIMLVPGVDLLKPYPDLKASIGGMAIVEINEGDHMDADLLGTNVQLLWYPVGNPVVTE